MTSAYLNKVVPTYIENWPDAMMALSIPQSDIRLSLIEAKAFYLMVERGSQTCDDADSAIEKLRLEFSRALSRFPDGAFVRLGSRSGKDSEFALAHGLRVTIAEEAVQMLTSKSRRLAFDLRLAIKFGYQPHVFVREWREIPPWAEFRCFMKNRQLAGISQYDCKNVGHHNWISDNANQIKHAISIFFDKFSGISHLDDVVFDIYLSRGGSKDDSLEVTLLEINPYFHHTDPCLFKWQDEDDFDGSFRFL
jgi:hypothetical protein